MMAAALNARQVETFREVYTHRSMTTAAVNLGVSQPAVSRIIAQLENAVGFLLFARLGNRLSPTAEADLLHEHVERWHLGLEQITSAATNIRSSHIGSIRISAMTGLSVGILNEVVARFLADRPKVLLSLRAGSSESVMRQVATHQADVGVVQLTPGNFNVHIHKLPAVEMVCIMPTGHPLSEKAVVDVTDLAGEPFISLGRESPVRIRTDALLLSTGVHCSRHIETSISASVCELVLRGFGVALVNPFLAMQFAERGLVFRRFQPALSYETAVIFPRHKAMPKLVQAFVDEVEAVFRAESIRDLTG
jgi:DNA-binding transcriptional LysR family regulator